MVAYKSPVPMRRSKSPKPDGPPRGSDNEVEMFTAKDLEELLKIDVKTLDGYVNRGLIPYVKIESNVRFPKQRIFDWIEQHTYLPKSATKHAPDER